MSGRARTTQRSEGMRDMTTVAERLPLGFAHRGGRYRDLPGNSLAAVRRALELGATGVETDIWLTSDGHAVLHHPRVPRPGALAGKPRSALSASVPDLESVYRLIGDSVDLAVDISSAEAAERCVQLARAHGAIDRLWLTYWRIDTLATWRHQWPDVHLVFPSLILPWRRPTALLDRLAAAGVDAFNLHLRQVSPAVVRGCHDRGLLLFAWGARDRSAPAKALGAGADGVFADDIPAMVAALRHRALPHSE